MGAVVRPSGHREVPGEVYGVRLLMLGWCIWLMGTWIVLFFTMGWAGQAFRVMVFASLIGLMGVWPAVRLSQIDPAAGGLRGSHGVEHPGLWAGACRRTLVDWLCLNLVWQAVVWPLRLAGGWGLGQAAWVSGAVAAWSLLTGLIIAWGRGTDGAGRRAAAMVVCLGVVLAEPLLMWGVRLSGQVTVATMRVSPLQAVWNLTAHPGAAAPGPWVQQVVAVALAAGAGWAALTLMLVLAKRRAA